MDITTLLSEHGNTDLVEVCDSNPILAHTAKSSGLTAECWTPQVFDLTSRLGYQAAERRLRKIRPKRLWLSTEHPENGRIVSDWLSSSWNLADTSISNIPKIVLIGRERTPTRTNCCMHTPGPAFVINALTVYSIHDLGSL